MKKYIDADRLRTEITDLFANAKFHQQKAMEEFDREDFVSSGGEIFAYTKILTLIDSLQQDEAQVDKLLCSKIWWEEQGWIMIPPDATIKGIDSLLKQVRKKLQQEQPNVDLD